MLPSAKDLEGKPVPNVTFKTLRGVTGAGTWPQVFIGGKLIGSADDVQKYFDAAKKAA